jgi:quinol monooxygenase YgiN
VVVTHVDVVPPRKDDAVGLLKSLGDAARKEDGNVRYEVVQQTNRPNHFTVIEIWKDRKAFDAHLAGATVREFRDKLAPMSGSLYDE